MPLRRPGGRADGVSIDPRLLPAVNLNCGDPFGSQSLVKPVRLHEAFSGGDSKFANAPPLQRGAEMREKLLTQTPSLAILGDCSVE